LVDIYSPEKRSELMSKISGTDTKPEIAVRKYLHSKGFRFKKNDKRLPGKPDIVLPKYNTAIFVHGCFWHGHKDCKSSKLPKTNREFWENKISDTMKRDKKNFKVLRNRSWKVIIIWECELIKKSARKERLNLLTSQIPTSSSRL